MDDINMGKNTVPERETRCAYMQQTRAKITPSTEPQKLMMSGYMAFGELIFGNYVEQDGNFITVEAIVEYKT